MNLEGVGTFLVAVLTEDPTRREHRDFDLESERRQRRLFTWLMVGFAILAILAGVIVAIWVIPPPDDIHLRPKPSKVAKEVEPLEVKPWEPVKEKPKPTGGGLKESLDQRDINRGISRMRAALDQCAQTHGAIDGTLVTVDFSVTGGGRVDEAYSRNPHMNTPLGKCVANVFKTKGRFRKSRLGLRDIRRTVKLRRRDLAGN